MNSIENDIFEVCDMDISAVKINVDTGSSAYGAQTASTSTPVPSTTDKSVATKGDVAVNPVVDDTSAKKTVNVADAQQMTAAMNKFVESLDVNIRFSLHQKTHELMVQIVDQNNNKVLREFPSHEFLDTVAAIQTYVGMLLDKKA